jgi:hypothetical protein
VGDLSTWGWVVLCIGVLELAVGVWVFVKNQFSRWAGVVVLAANAIAQLLMMPAYPFWSLCIFALGILAIYGLVAYGKPGRRELTDRRRDSEARKRRDGMGSSGRRATFTLGAHVDATDGRCGSLIRVIVDPTTVQRCCADRRGCGPSRRCRAWQG